MGYYELTERVGSGGMGEVWRAKHRMLARPAAIKLISPERLGGHSDLSSTLIRRFEREAQATAMLQSPHTIQLYDFGVTDNGSLYYAMEYLNGLDMQSLVETYGPVPPERAVHFLMQIMESLEEAHEAGVIHRDIKPSNIFVSKHGLNYDFVKVLDFGLARISASDDASLTMPSIAAGTPAFMSPEAALGEATVDGRSDLYAVGAVGYWLLPGRNVFEGSTAYATVLEHLHSEPVPPSRRSESAIPRSLDEIILWALAKDPLRRPQSAREMAERLSAVVTAEQWAPERAEHWWRVHRPTTSLPSKPEAAGVTA